MLITAPKRQNTTTSEHAIPTLIIIPSEITGLISQKISDINPTIVVKIAKKHGLARSRKTAYTSWRCEKLGNLALYSR